MAKLGDGRPFLLVTRGLPASGKSTWALEQCRQNKDVVRVNRDQIRLMLGKKWDYKLEKLVTEIRDAAIIAALVRGKSVINDDTNLSEERMRDLKRLADLHQVQWLVNDEFLFVPVETCIERDAARQVSVGKDVIEKLYFQYWETQTKPPNTGERMAVMCDLDGTLALIPSGANPYDRDFTQDLLNGAVATVLRQASDDGIEIILMSGRDSKHADKTREWLSSQGIGYDQLIMRNADDRRKDSIVKKELYMQYVQGRFTILYVLDDRPSVVRMWRAELGLPVFQVGPNVEF